MRARRYPWPGTAIENATEAVELLEECQRLFQKLRPQIERVAPGQKRRRMPAEAYTLWGRLGSLGVNLRHVNEFIRNGPPTRAEVRTDAEATATEGNVVSLAVAKEKLADFKTGRLAWHHWCEATRAFGPADDRVRELHATAVRELERYGRALAKSAEMRALAKIEWSSGRGWDGWHLEKIAELAELLEAKERSTARLTPSTTAKPAWDGKGAVIQFERLEPGPFAGGEP